jgi:hypothetical protein
MNIVMHINENASVVWWSEFLAAVPEILGSIPALLHFLRRSGTGTGSTQPRQQIRSYLINGRGSSTALTTRHPSIHKSWH